MKNLYALCAAVLTTAILASPIVTGKATTAAPIFAISAPVVMA